MIRRLACPAGAFLAALPLLFASGVPAHARAAGATGAAFLELSYGPRWSAMGNAGTAWAEDAMGMPLNPAGIGLMERPQIQFAHDARFADVSDNLFSYARPWRDYDAWGLSLLYVDLGSVRRTTFSAPTGTLGEATASDLAVSATYARRLSRAITVGVTGKVVYESLDTFNATGFAMDAGIHYQTPVEGLTLGASLLHVGTGLKFVRETDDFPLTIRTGAGYRTPSRRLGVATDLVFTKNQDPEARIGGEYWVVRDMLALRLGFNSGNDLDHGVSLGLGANVSQVNFDYAYTPFGDLGNVHQVGIGYTFGAGLRREFPRGEAPARARRAQPQEGPPSAAAAGYRWGVRVAPFEITAAGIEWWGSATPQVLGDLLTRRGVPVNPDPATSAWVLEGEYRPTGAGIQAAALLRSRDGTRAPEMLFAEGTPDAPFRLWDALAGEVARRLPGAPSAVSAAPVRPMQEVPRYLPPPLPPRRPDVEVTPVEGSGSSTTEAEQIAVRLTEAITRKLAERGLSVGPNAPLVVRVAFSLEGDGRIVLWGRVLDAATGIPVRSISATGFASRSEDLAERVASEVVLAAR